jgi:hypothetical protein
MSPRWAPDPPARRALEKLLATARDDPLFGDGDSNRLEALLAYCARAYQLGRDRGRRELMKQMGGRGSW